LGAFDALAGVAVSKTTDALAWKSIEIQPGDYLVFSAKGPMPQTVVQTWGTVWQYFQVNPGVVRCYKTDFEVYRGVDEVAVYIGVL
jgi:predicted transcriptional regulator YdeE